MVSWHPKGEVLVSCSYDDSIKVWVEDDGEWECAQTLAGPGLGHSSTVWEVAFDASGQKMVSCSDDCTLKIWSCHFDNPGRLHVHALCSVHSTSPISTLPCQQCRAACDYASIRTCCCKCQPQYIGATSNVMPWNCIPWVNRHMFSCMVCCNAELISAVAQAHVA